MTKREKKFWDVYLKKWITINDYFRKCDMDKDGCCICDDCQAQKQLDIQEALLKVKVPEELFEL